MRKLCMALLCIRMAAMLTLTASAADASVSLTASADSVSRGDTFTVVAELNNTQQIKMGSVALQYDTAALEMVGGKCHVSVASVKAVLPDQKVGTFLAMTDKKISGKLFTFEFKVLDTAPVGQYTIAAEAAIGTSKGEPIEAGSVQIDVAYRPGDLPAETVTATAPETSPESTAGATLEPTPESTSATVPTQQTQSQSPEETTAPQVTDEATAPEETDAAETTVPVQTEAPAREDTPKESNFLWTGPIAAVILGIIGVCVKLFRKEKEE